MADAPDIRDSHSEDGHDLSILFDRNNATDSWTQVMSHESWVIGAVRVSSIGLSFASNSLSSPFYLNA